ncbi:MAG: invasion associated locus B family protein [Hyphomicrobiaceae bacterium]
MVVTSKFTSSFKRALHGAIGVCTVAGLVLGASSALAQDKKKAAKKAEAAATQPAAEPVMWVKLCEKAPVMDKGADGKPKRVEKGICLTHHERLDGNTGMVLVSAAIRQVEGQDKQHLMIMVPLGMAIQPGLRAAVYNKEMWEKAQKNEKVDDTKLKPIRLNFSLCHPAGCTAELELKKELLADLKSGAGIMVFAINANGQVIAFPVPLAGFSKAIDGAAADNAAYTAERRRLMQEIAKRQQAALEEYKKKQAEAAAQAGGKAADKKK